MAGTVDKTRPVRSAGIAAWSVRHPVGVVMITLAVTVIGLFSSNDIGVDLLPEIVYPSVSVRIREPGVPAAVMEERVTRLVEEQLALTEGAIGVESRSREGLSAINLQFEYGANIDEALRDASNRLERARRALPQTIDPPVIYKRDPSQIPVMQISVSSVLRDPVELRDWVDADFSKSLLGVPGVAAVEVGGGLRREISIVPDQGRLDGLGLEVADIVASLGRNNMDAPAGQLRMPGMQIGGRTAGRFASVEEIATLPVSDEDEDGVSSVVRLSEVAEIIDGSEDEVLRLRLNGIPGIKVSIQKLPHANTVAVVDVVRERLQHLRDTSALPPDIDVRVTGDQSTYVRHSLRNAAAAGLGGALLAMLVVYVFLGNLRRTLVVASAIPIAVTLTFTLMALGDMTMNIMTLGGLALGIGMLVDSTIVMLENIHRHQSAGEPAADASLRAAAEVNSAIVASTSTNLAAVLPFLFIGGLLGLLFRELIFTLSAAILASMLVALTLVPALAGRIPVRRAGYVRSHIDRALSGVQKGYMALVRRLIRHPAMTVLAFSLLFAVSLIPFFDREQLFLPTFDEGRVLIRVVADAGIDHDEMDRVVSLLERALAEEPEVSSVFASVGGFVFGRNTIEAPNRASLSVQLSPADSRAIGREAWAERFREKIQSLRLVGFRTRVFTPGIRGIRMGKSEDQIGYRIRGANLETLTRAADEVVEKLAGVDGLRNVRHSAQGVGRELAVRIDRDRAADLDVSVQAVGDAMRTALTGTVVGDYLDGGRLYPIRVRLPESQFMAPADLAGLLVATARDGRSVRLGEIASIDMVASQSQINRENQRRIVEINAAPALDRDLDTLRAQANAALADMALPAGYSLYDAGDAETRRKGREMGWTLLALAIFLVFVVMAVQYESLRNPLVILFAVPFAASGVGMAVYLLDMPLSMPVWLGLIMLAGIVVNNAIVLVEQVEILRRADEPPETALVTAAGLRLRPILMTTLTTVIGMLPLAIGFGEGAEMIRPIAVTVVSGLSFSMLVSLLLIPSVYRLAHRRAWQQPEAVAASQS